MSWANLILSFVTESIERSRETIIEEAFSSIELTHENLINELAASDDALTKELDQDPDLQKPLGEPLFDMKLKFEDKVKGKIEVIETSIGKRMAYFQAKASRKEHKLAKLWRDWEAIQNQICAFGEEVLGLQAPSGGEITVTGPFKEENEKFSQQITTEKANLGDEIASMCSGAIQRMKNNEKVLFAFKEGGHGADLILGIDDYLEEAATGYVRSARDTWSGYLKFTNLQSIQLDLNLLLSALIGGSALRLPQFDHLAIISNGAFYRKPYIATL